jgi:hypothetical protein
MAYQKETLAAETHTDETGITFLAHISMYTHCITGRVQVYDSCLSLCLGKNST